MRVFNPRAVQSLRATARTQTRIVNREAELQQLAQALDDSLQKQLRVLCLEGGAGLGKSRLIAELTGWARERGAQVLRGEGDAVEQQTSYSAWRSIFEAYFDIEELTEQAARRAQTLTVLSRIAPDLLARAPLLNNLLNLGIPETPLTANLEPKLRQASLSALLVDLLALRAQAQALVIVVEGAQWLDSLSWQLALLAARSLVDAPVLLALTLRPLAAPYPLSPPDHPYTLICALQCSRRLTISALAPADIVSLAASRLGSDELPADIARLIEQRASGNPLVAEALAVSLRDLGIIAVVDGECVVRGDIGELHVPDTLHGLVLSSLDRLPAEEQLALKLASVVGRAFGFAALRDIYPANMDRRQLPRSLHALIRREIVRAARPQTTLRTHSYAQAIVQEVTYSTLLQTQRRELHERIARWFEGFAADQQTDLHPLLAHHWRQAQNAERELRYAALAGRKLAAEYANHEALSFLNRALQLASDADKRFELLWLRMEVHDRIGDRQAQNEDLAQLEALAEQSADVRRRAQLANARADYHRNVSDFSAAIAQLQRARTLAQEARDSAADARSLTLWGQVLEHQGSYREAKDYFAQALAIYQQIDYKRGEANNLSRLSNIYHYLGDRASARDYALQALAIRRAIGDRASEATSLTNLGRICAEMGEHDTARDYRQQALAVARTIGDRAGEAFSLLTIGNGYLTQGDYGEARRCLQQALRLFEMMGERRRTATCLNELGMVWREIGDAANGRRHFERALVIQQEIGNRSFAAYTHLNLGLTYLPADPATARAHYRSALALAQETGNRAVEAYALAYLAALHAQTGDWDAARRDYQTAIEINTELKAAPAAVEATAGLARVALAQSQAAEALQHARACLAHIAAKGVEGIEFPFEVYLACYDVLRATGEQAEAERALAQAHALLMRRADAISDPQLRESMLNNVAAHRRIIEEFVGRNAGG